MAGRINGRGAPNDNGGRRDHGGYTLVIGDKNFSSWSLRPWIAMKRSASLRRGAISCASREQGSDPAPFASGKVPALKTNGLVVCDSLAILEYLAERHPELKCGRGRGGRCPLDLGRDAFGLRRAPQRDVDGAAAHPYPPIGDELARDISRIVAIWRDAGRYGAGGPFLFGAFSNADAMYAPVATRFRTYGVDLAAFGDDGTAASYAETILALPAMAEWTEGAEAEIRTREAG